MMNNNNTIIDLTNEENDSDNDNSIEFLNFRNQYVIKDKKEIKISHVAYSEKKISISYEISKFKNLKSKLKLFHLGRRLSNGLSGGFSGDITNPYLIPSIIKFIQENNILPYIDGICDIGCGSGRIGVAVKSFFPYNYFIGLENNLEIARIALDNLSQIDDNFSILYGDASNILFQNYINMNDINIIHNINIIYSFNDANLGMDIAIFLFLLKKNTKLLMITSFFKSFYMYDIEIYNEIKNIIGNYFLYTNLKLSGQQKKFKLKIYKITDDIKKKLIDNFEIVKTNEPLLISKGINFKIQRRN